MKVLRTAAVATAAILLPASLLAQQRFEGTVHYTMTMAQGMTMDLVQHVKGDKVRQEMTGPMGAVVTILDSTTGQAHMLMTAQKAYMTMDLKAMAAQQTETGEIKVERTDRTETVAGHACEHVLITTANARMDYCMSRQLPFHLPGNIGGGRGQGMPSANARVEAELRKLFKDGGFPLKMEISTPNQNLTMVATRVEKGSVENSMFEIPADFRKMGGPGSG